MNIEIYANRERQRLQDLKVAQQSQSDSQQEVQDIPLKDRIVLGPIDRYKKYGYFPWKFVVHILLTVLTSVQILFIVDGQIDNSYFVLNNFYNNFMTFGSETALTGGVIKLFKIDQVQTFVNTTVQNYYNINSDYSLDYYDNLDPETGVVIPV